MTEPLGRLVADVPRWTTHEKEGRKASPKPRVQSGVRFIGGPQSWCYLCGSEHRHGEPCLQRGRRRVPEPLPACAFCGASIPKESRRKTYCRALCRDDAKVKRRHEAKGTP